MKKVGKIVSAVIAAALAASMLGGCSSEPEGTELVTAEQTATETAEQTAAEKETEKQTEAETTAVTEEQTTKKAFIADDEELANETDFESAREAVANMHAGINIGNTFECVDLSADQYSDSGVNPGWMWNDMHQGPDPAAYETAWGNPPVSQKYIQGIKKAGFDAVRLPVTWGVHCDADGNINEVWISRIQEVVDWILEEDMYCIVNMHHDAGTGGLNWINEKEENYGKNSARVANIWTNIAERFKNYDEKLIFEGYNEMVNVDYSPNDMTVLNKWNQLFVDTVRSTGGRNAYRNLSVQSVGGGYDYKRMESVYTDKFKIPDDSVQNHIILQVHNYQPDEFTWPLDDPNRVSKETPVWGSAETEELERNMKTIAEFADMYDVPMIIGEYAAAYNGNTEEVVKYVECFIGNANKYGIACFWWDDINMVGVGKTRDWDAYDNPNETVESYRMGLFNRVYGLPMWKEVADAIISSSYQR